MTSGLVYAAYSQQQRTGNGYQKAVTQQPVGSDFQSVWNGNDLFQLLSSFVRFWRGFASRIGLLSLSLVWAVYVGEKSPRCGGTIS